jgi:ABC-2 type transport system permease protein
MPALRHVYAWELRKLVAQKRTYLGLTAAALVPVIFVVALALQTGQPEDVPFGRYVRQSGLAIPPVILIFGSYWLFPLITALVSGDIVAAEDHNGTLKTILTRSAGRGRIASGFHPLVTLSGTTVSASRALLLIGASLLVYLLPLFAIASIALLLSTITHNSAAAVVGALMISLLLQLITIVPGLGALQPYLLPEQFNAWQGFLRTPADWAPVIRAAWVCALYALPCLGAAYLSFLRRDVAGG